MSTTTERSSRNAPQALGEILVRDIEDTFSRAPKHMTAPCRLAFVQGKIEMRQQLGRPVPDALWELHDQLRDKAYPNGPFS